MKKGFNICYKMIIELLKKEKVCSCPFCHRKVYFNGQFFSCKCGLLVHKIIGITNITKNRFKKLAEGKEVTVKVKINRKIISAKIALDPEHRAIRFTSLVSRKSPTLSGPAEVKKP